MNMLRLRPAGASSVALVIALCASVGAWAQAISQFPSLVITPPPPNVILTLDDSGSMNWGFIPDSVGAQDATAGFAASVYNGAYYNPSVFYPTPRDADGRHPSMSGPLLVGT